MYEISNILISNQKLKIENLKKTIYVYLWCCWRMLVITQSLKDKEYHPNLYIRNKQKHRSINIACNFYMFIRQHITQYFLPKRRQSYLGVELFTNSIFSENCKIWLFRRKVTSNKRREKLVDVWEMMIKRKYLMKRRRECRYDYIRNS